MFKRCKKLSDLYFKLKLEEIKLKEIGISTIFPYFRDGINIEDIVDYVHSYYGGLSNANISKVKTSTAKANKLKMLFVTDLLKALELIDQLKHTYHGITLLPSYGLTKRFKHLRQSVTITFQASNKSLIYSISEKNKKHIMMTYDNPKEIEDELLISNFNRILELDFKEIIKILEKRREEEIAAFNKDIQSTIK